MKGWTNLRLANEGSNNKLETKFVNYNNCHCIIDKIFTGGLQSDVICSYCNYVSTKVDPFWDISLEIRLTDLREPLRLEDCLFRFTLPEILTSFNCSFCKCTKEAKKQLTMKNLPIVCCFHLKRFEQSNKIHKKSWGRNEIIFRLTILIRLIHRNIPQ